MNGHRHTAGPEHDFEPVPGLPEPLPPGERMIWQGAPDWRSLAIRAFHVRKLAVYFAVLVAWHGWSRWDDGASARELAVTLGWTSALAIAAIGIALVLARLAARNTMYTVTDRRVVMRIGIVLTVSFNLPYARIASAGLRLHADGTGDLPLLLAEGDRIGYAQLWPHARPWRLSRTEPMLRCVPDAQAVGALLSQAWSQSTGIAPQPAPARAAAPRALEPKAAGRLAPAPVATAESSRRDGRGDPRHALAGR